MIFFPVNEGEIKPIVTFEIINKAHYYNGVFESPFDIISLSDVVTYELAKALQSDPKILENDSGPTKRKYRLRIRAFLRSILNKKR